MRIVRLAACVLLLVATTARAQVPSGLPQDVRDAVRLLPTDIESLAGTLQPFAFSATSPDRDWASKPGATLTFDAIVELCLSSVDRTSGFRMALDSIRGRQALWAITAKRDQEIRTESGGKIIKLGLHPFESITIVKFSAVLPVELRQALGSVSPLTSLANGVDVYRATDVPAAVVLPRPDMLILVTTIAAGDAMLKSLLARLDNAAGAAALDDAGRAWSLIDFDASLWTLRRTKMRRPGSPQDNVGRDWEIFAYDRRTPSRALFRNVRTGTPWQGRIDEARTASEPVDPRRILSGGGYADMRVECGPQAGFQCFFLSFLVDGLGVMVWI